MTRRANGEGSYVQQKDGSWRWFLTMNGKRISLRAKTKPLLNKRIKEFFAKREGHNDQIVTVKEWTERWLANAKLTIKIKSYDSYVNDVQLYIIPRLGSIRLTDLNTITIQDMFTDLKKHGGVSGKQLSPATINSIRTTLNVLLNAAVDSNMISRNPAKRTKRIKQEKSEIPALSKDQLANLIELASQQDYIYTNAKCKYNENEGSRYLRECYYRLLILEAATGMRKGEIYALSWDDVDLKNGTLYIHRNLQRTSEGLTIYSPKNNKGRKITIDNDTLDKISEWKDMQDDYAEKYAGIFDNKYNLLFTNSFGNPIDNTNYQKRYWNKLAEAAQLPKGFRWYDLRHTHATLLLSNGVPIKVVSERLGHSTVQMTMNIYYKFLPNQQGSAADVFNSLDIYGNNRSQDDNE